MEFALGMHPRVPDRSPASDGGFPGLPVLETTASGLRWSFPLRDPDTNPQVRVEVRSTRHPAVVPWPDVVVPHLVPGRPGWFDASCDLPASPDARRFLRLEATLLPSLTYPD